jgi:hypothetical protein
MHKQLQGLVWVIATLALSACGGGGGDSGGGSSAGGGSGGGTSISLSVSSVSWTIGEGDPSPAPIDVNITYSGAGVVVGYAPGVPQPNWLVVGQATGTATTATVSLSAVDVVSAGTYTTSVRFATGLSDGSAIKYVDLPVTLTVTASPLAISVAPTSLDFGIGQIPGPAPAAQTVSVTFNGDTVLSYSAPSWLTVSAPADQSVSPAVFSVQPAPGIAAGMYSGDVQFATRKAPSSFLRLTTLHVTYVLNEHFDVASAAPIAFSGLARTAQTAPGAGYTLVITGSQSRWHASTNQSWLKVSAAGGSGSGSLIVTADGSAQGHGSYTGTVTVNDDTSGAVFTFNATLAERAPALVVTPSSLTFTLDSLSPATKLSQAGSISDELGGAFAGEAVTWSVQSISAPWLKWAPSSGSSAPGAAPTVTLSTTELSKLKPGPYSATVTLAATDADGTAQTVTVPVSLQFDAAYVNYVGPYLGLANQGGQLFVRGANFAVPAAPLPVSIGSTSIGSVVPDSDTQLRVTYAGLPPGRYPVHIQNTAGFDTQSADLVIVAPPTYTYAAINAPSQRTRIVYDAERQALYGVNRVGQQIEFYDYASSTWTVGAPYVLPQLNDVQLLPDGHSLIALAQNNVDEIVLDQTPLTAQTRATNTDSFCGRDLDNAAVANDGKVFVVSGLTSCSGGVLAFVYDAASYSLTQTPYPVGSLYDGTVAASADGSKLYATNYNISSGDVLVFDALTDTLTDSRVTALANRISVSGDASRVILQSTDVYSGALTLTGHLPSGPGLTPLGVALASRDSTKAFLYRDDAPGPRIEIYDLTLPLQAGQLYQLVKTVSLTDSPDASAGTYSRISLAATPDDATVFVSGDSKILVVPVQ